MLTSDLRPAWWATILTNNKGERNEALFYFQTENNSYDTFDSAAVIAESEEQAKMINPENGKIRTKEQWENTWNTWASSPDNVNVE